MHAYFITYKARVGYASSYDVEQRSEVKRLCVIGLIKEAPKYEIGDLKIAIEISGNKRPIDEITLEIFLISSNQRDLNVGLIDIM